MRLLIIAILLVLLSACNTVWDEPFSPNPDTPDAQGYYSSSSGSYNLRYKRIGTDSLECIVSANTNGWLAVGFDPSMQMKDANIIIAYVADGEGFIRDDWGISNTTHVSDISLGSTNDVRLLEASENAGRSSVRFRIALSSGDTRDRILIPGNTYPIIFAHGESDDFDSYHSGIGIGNIRIP